MALRSKRKRSRDDDGSQDNSGDPGGTDTYFSPRKRAIPKDKFQWKEKIKARVGFFAQTADFLAEKSADLITGGATKGLQRNYVSNFLGLNASEQQQQQAEEDPFFQTGGDFDAPVSNLFSDVPEDATQHDDNEESFSAHPSSSSSSHASQGNRPSTNNFSFGGGGLFRRKKPQQTDVSDNEGNDSEEESNDGDEEQSSTTVGRRGNEEIDETRRDEQDDEAYPFTKSNDFATSSFSNRSSSPIRHYGTVFLGCSLAVCWAIILLAIPLLPIFIASWLVSDFLQHNVFNSG